MSLPGGARRNVGRYELIRPLGSGGMGTVFEARDVRSGARVALKALREHTGTALHHLKREFRALSELAHPSVVRFGELFEDQGQLYFTMELIEGCDFLEHVRPGARRLRAESGETSTLMHSETQTMRPRQGTSRVIADDVPRLDPPGMLDESRLRDALGQLASGLMALHAAGLVHRDIKPQNVLVTREGRVTILDFGLAVHAEDGPRAELAGTVAYMAPEQFSGKPVTAAADWYSVGVVLYEALTGRYPHSGSSLDAITQRLSRPPAPPRAHAEGLPEDLCALCMRLLEIRPEDRPVEDVILSLLGRSARLERGRASFRSQLHFSRGVFVARERELAELRKALDQAQQGQCAVMRLVGESGVGKTALMRQLVRELREQHTGALVLSGRCYERETFPYRGVDLVVDALAQHLRELAERGEEIACPGRVDLLGNVFPALRAFPAVTEAWSADAQPADPQQARRLAFAALKGLIREIARRRALLIHVDDAQWLDAESAALIAYLIEGDDAPGLLLVLAQRPLSGANPIDELMRPMPHTRMELAPLEAAEARRLAEALLQAHGRPSSSAGLVAQRAGGHPLFIHELVLHEHAAQSPALSLETALLHRIDSLDADGRRLLEIIALASTPLSHGVARPSAALPPEKYTWVLLALRGENLVTFKTFDEGDDVQTYHDRIRELVVRQMTDEARRRGHGRLAEQIEAHSPSDHDTLTYHHAASGNPAEAAVHALLAAERALAQLAFERAARLFDVALEAAPDGATRAELQERKGEALANAGRGHEAAAAYLAAADLRQGVDAFHLRRLAGEQLLRAGHIERGTAILYALLGELGQVTPKDDRGTTWSLLRGLGYLWVRGLDPGPLVGGRVSARDRLRLQTCWTLATGISMVHHLPATDFQARSLVLALEAGEKQWILKSAALLGAMLGMSGPALQRPAMALRALAERLGTEMPSPENGAWLALSQGVMAMGDWDFGACERLCRRAEVLLRECTGVAWETATARAFLLWSLAFQGKLREAACELPDLFSSARARGDRYLVSLLTLSVLHLVGLAADKPGRVRVECEAVMKEWPEDLACFQHMCAEYVLAHVDLYEGRSEQAWDHVLLAWKMLRRNHLSRMQFQRIDLVGLRARAALARASATEGLSRRRWLRLAQGDARRLLKERITAARAMASLVKGGIAAMQGKRRAAAKHFDRAVDDYDRQGMMLHRGMARLAVALVLRDPDGGRHAESVLIDLGVTRPTTMLRLWVPGLA